jgi:TPR repeat protein
MKDAETLYAESLKHIGEYGYPENYAKAFSLNAAAAALGFHDAVLAMGWFYLNGLGVPENLHQAERWYRRSARLGDPKECLVWGKSLMMRSRLKSHGNGLNWRTNTDTRARFIGWGNYIGAAKA